MVLSNGQEYERIDLKSWDPQGSYGFDSRPRHHDSKRLTAFSGINFEPISKLLGTLFGTKPFRTQSRRERIRTENHLSQYRSDDLPAARAQSDSHTHFVSSPSHGQEFPVFLHPHCRTESLLPRNHVLGFLD